MSTKRMRGSRITLIVAITLAVFPTIKGQTASPSPTPSAAPPASDIFIVDVRKVNGELKLGQPKKITDLPVYNNQPFFLDGHTILYTSFRDKQTDIYRYDIRTGKTTQVTNTPESEYSPTLMPDGKN